MTNETEAMKGVTTHDIKVPSGWRIEHVPERRASIIYSPAPCSYMATVDWAERGVRTGFSTTGRFIDGWYPDRKTYKGRTWRQDLVNAAVAHLESIPR